MSLRRQNRTKYIEQRCSSKQKCRIISISLRKVISRLIVFQRELVFPQVLSIIPLVKDISTNGMSSIMQREFIRSPFKIDNKRALIIILFLSNMETESSDVYFSIKCNYQHNKKSYQSLLLEYLISEKFLKFFSSSRLLD